MYCQGASPPGGFNSTSLSNANSPAPRPCSAAERGSPGDSLEHPANATIAVAMHQPRAFVFIVDQAPSQRSTRQSRRRSFGCGCAGHPSHLHWGVQERDRLSPLSERASSSTYRDSALDCGRCFETREDCAHREVAHVVPIRATFEDVASLA